MITSAKRITCSIPHRCLAKAVHDEDWLTSFYNVSAVICLAVLFLFKGKVPYSNMVIVPAVLMELQALISFLSHTRSLPQIFPSSPNTQLTTSCTVTSCACNECIVQQFIGCFCPTDEVCDQLPAGAFILVQQNRCHCPIRLLRAMPPASPTHTLKALYCASSRTL